MASVFALLEAFNRKEAAALGFFPCATAFLVLICLLKSDIRKMQLLVETENAFQVRSKIVLIFFRKKILLYNLNVAVGQSKSEWVKCCVRGAA